MEGSKEEDVAAADDDDDSDMVDIGCRSWYDEDEYDDDDDEVPTLDW